MKKYTTRIHHHVECSLFPWGRLKFTGAHSFFCILLSDSAGSPLLPSGCVFVSHEEWVVCAILHLSCFICEWKHSAPCGLMAYLPSSTYYSFLEEFQGLAEEMPIAVPGRFLFLFWCSLEWFQWKAKWLTQNQGERKQWSCQHMWLNSRTVQG